MGVAIGALCRGEGVGYVAIVAQEEHPGLAAKAATSDGMPVPCELLEVDTPSVRARIAPAAPAAWVLVVPLLDRSCVIELCEDDAVLRRVVFAPRKSKIASRLLTRRQPQVAQTLRGFEYRYGHGRTEVHIQRVWPAEDERVTWRVHVVYPTDDNSLAPSLVAFDASAHELGAAVVLMEDHVVPSMRNAGLFERLVTFSVTLPQSIGQFYLRAWLGEEERFGGFAGMNAARAQGMLRDTQRMIAGAHDDEAYGFWLEERRATSRDLARQRETCATLLPDERPLISVVMPIAQSTRADFWRAIESVQAQSYDSWELVVALGQGVGQAPGAAALDDLRTLVRRDDRMALVATDQASFADVCECGLAQAVGAYVAVLYPNAELEPNALWEFVQAMRAHPNADALYCDEDVLQDGRGRTPSFKTFPNYGALYARNYVGHLFMVSRYALDRMAAPTPGLVAAQDYDLVLRTFEVARQVVRVPKLLHHTRSREQACEAAEAIVHDAGRRALEAHLTRRGLAACVEDGPVPQTYRVRFTLPDQLPLVSIVIPTKDHVDLLNTCVTSILERSTYPRIEVVLVENNSVEPQTFAFYDELTARDDRVRVSTWQPSKPGDFNYSAIINQGAREARGEVLVLLNNDTEVVAPDWIEQMLSCLMRPEVGVVGAKLLFGDGLIQHVGMVANPNGDNCHVCQNLSARALGPTLAAALPGDYNMVTGACQMVRRSVFDELGGYDEELAVGFNDGDFCLRACERGYAVAMAAEAVLHHREFSTRGREVTDARLRSRFLTEKARIMRKHATFYAEGDPALNPNLNGLSAYFELGW